MTPGAIDSADNVCFQFLFWSEIWRVKVGLLSERADLIVTVLFDVNTLHETFGGV